MKALLAKKSWITPAAVLLLVGLLIYLALFTPLSWQIFWAERQWQRQKIDSYQIEVREVTDIWHLQTHRIIVKNGLVADYSASCSPAPAEFGQCKVWNFDPQDFTVPGLFELARRSASIASALSDVIITINFDPTYRFPGRIALNNPAVTDGHHSWQVTGFEPLE